jgi:cytochrome P450
MMAGRDTTAALLGWCLLRLALQPEIYSSLREACLRDFPPGTQPDFNQLKGCRPLQHFLQEVLRLHATVPMNNRLCVKDTTLPLGGGADQNSPIAVRAGQIVTFSVYFMHRRKDLWGEDALEFRPSRWEEKVPAWQWLPFLGGPRVCLGQQFALTEAGFMLVRLLREFDAVQAVDEVEMRRMRKGVGLTLCKLEEYFWLPGSIIMLTEDFNRAC